MRNLIVCLFLGIIVPFSGSAQTQLSVVKDKLNTFLSTYNVYEGGLDDTKHGYKGELTITDVSEESNNTFVVEGTYRHKYYDVIKDGHTTAKFRARFKALLDEIDIVCLNVKTIYNRTVGWGCYYVHLNCNDFACPE